MASPSSTGRRLAHEDDRELRRVRLRAFLQWMRPVAVAFGVLYVGAGMLLHSGALLAAAADVTLFFAALLVARARLDRGALEDAAEIIALGLVLMCVVGAVLLPWLRSALLLIPVCGVALALPDLAGARLRRFLWITFASEAAIVLVATFLPPLFAPPPPELRSLVVVTAATIAAGLTFALLFQDARRLRLSIETADFHALRVQAVVERAPVVVFAVDREGRFTLSEGLGLAAFGLAPGESVGRSAFTLYRELEWFTGAIRAALAGRETSVVGRIGERVFEVHLRPHEGGAIGVTNDITARHRAEEGLRVLAEASHVLAREVDASALERVAQAVVASFATACTIELEPVDLQAAIRVDARRDDREPVARLAAPLRSRDGATLGRVEIASSERAFAAADVALLDDVAARIAAAIEGHRLYEAARRAVRARDEFLSVASHELKTPLTPLQLDVVAVERAADRGDVARMRDRAAKLQRHVARLTGLVDDLLDVARIRVGRVSLHRKRCDAAEIVRAAIARIEPELERVGCAVTVRVEGETRGDWDPSRIDQVVTNLLSNAAKYAPNHPIEVRVAQRGGDVILAVRDRGIGISLEDQKRIFGRFERAVNDRNYGGLGLGLFIAREIVEAHGGAIDVESAPGQGATFTVTLPMHADHFASAQQRNPVE